MRAMRERSVLLAVLGSMVMSLAMIPPTAATVEGVAYFGDRSKHVVALTFDDGYDVVPCQRILATLRRDRVPATFFPTGDSVQANPAFWRSVDAASYTIGDHSMTHPQMTRLNVAQQRAELVGSRTVIERILGHPMTDIFRPPYGDVDATVVASARRAGFPTVVYWDTSAADSSSRGTDAQHIAAGSRGQNGSIVLMHCGPSMTPRILPSIIANYRQRGFGFVTLPQMLGVLGPRPVFTTPAPTMLPLATATPSPRIAPVPRGAATPSFTEFVPAGPSSTIAAPAPEDLPAPPATTRSILIAALAISAAALLVAGIVNLHATGSAGWPSPDLGM